MSLIDNATVRVRRGGTYLTIPANATERYIAKGYDIVDSKGVVLKESVPNELNAVKAACNRYMAENKALKERIKELETQLSKKDTVAEVISEEKPTSVKKSKKSK